MNELLKGTDMVWGVVLPSGFGDYWPYGDFDSFKAQLAKNFEAMSPEELAPYSKPTGPSGVNHYAGNVFEKFIKDPNLKGPDTLPFRTLAENEWPAEYALRKRTSTLGSLIKMQNRLLAVDEVLKNIIERLEPDVHQFRRVIITMPRGVVYQVPYYTMVIGQFFDSFSPEESDKKSWRSTGFMGEPRHFRFDLFFRKKEQANGLAFSKSVFGKSHLWRDRSFRTAVINISDTLHDEIIKAGLRLPKHYHMKEV